MPETIREGDELVLFDGRSTDEVIKELMKEGNMGLNQEKDLSNACSISTFRHGMCGHIVPEGSITIGVKSPHSSNIHEHKLTWMLITQSEL